MTQVQEGADRRDQAVLPMAFLAFLAFQPDREVTIANFLLPGQMSWECRQVPMSGRLRLLPSVGSACIFAAPIHFWPLASSPLLSPHNGSS